MSPPIVSIVTPVYNAEKYLDECIESVLAQTFDNWEYIIVNNCSTDNSLEIARQYAKRYEKIRVHNNEKFLDLMPNWNHAISQISPDSKYCKVVHADDWIFPKCLEKMVRLAEANPSVGIVSAYRLDENTVNLDGLPYPSTMIPGHEICRSSLMGGPYVFGSPTSILIRCDLIRKRRLFYNEDNIHADKEVCYDLLRESDFGFIHQVLTFTRRHNEAETSFCKMYDTYRAGKILLTKKYGPTFLSDEEYNCRIKKQINDYHAFLARKLFEFKTVEYFKYHKTQLEKLGIHISSAKVIFAILKEFRHPLRILKRLRTGIVRKILAI
jgi:glycosyltransferase involved in cell wall biosynthesis